MIKFWAKIYKDDKIITSYVLYVINYDYHKFDTYITEICDKLDIPTPVILDKHIIDFTVYKHTKFVFSDFIESINFDKLVLQMI